MAILTNPRHEKFAQVLAAGESAAEANERAGYKPNYGNAVRLKRYEKVATHVAELQSRGTARA